MVRSAVSIRVASIPLFGAISDRVGRRPVYLFGSITTGVLAFPLFWMMDSGSPRLVWLGLALVLAIGIVVDDAIVVVEAVHAKMDAGEKDAKQAAIQAMSEIAPAIVSITLVMAAVFVPVVIAIALVTFAIWYLFGPAPAFNMAFVNFIAVLLSSRLILGEPIPTLRYVGFACILVGLYIVTRAQSGAH